MQKRKLAVYIHIPFCVRKCKYCDFVSGSYPEEVQKNYVNQLLKEIDWFFEENREEKIEISSIFFGGGTPSILPAEEIERILCKLKGRAEFADPEITIEVNPGIVTGPEERKADCPKRAGSEVPSAGNEAGKLTKYRDAGINRISIGLQSANDKELQILGRIHTYEDFRQTYEEAVKAGFDNINVDILYAIPGQNYASFERTVRRVASLNPRPAHISAYSLILEEGTPFYETDFHALGLDLPDEEEERRMYRGVADILEEYGYAQYEISNYALPGKECKHNCAYWLREEYAGFGVAAASLIRSSGAEFLEDTDFRYRNTSVLEKYLQANSYEELKSLREETETLSPKEQMSETVILGLRMNRGVKDKVFFEFFGEHLSDVFGNVLSKHIQNGLLYENPDGDIVLTDKGRDLANIVMADFLSD